MRTFRRRIFAAGAVVSAILLLVCLVQWPRSYFRDGYTNSFYGQYLAGFSNGRRGSLNAGLDCGLPLPQNPSSFAVVRDRRVGAGGMEFEYVTFSTPPSSKLTRQIDFTIQAWQGLFLTAALPVWWLLQRRRRLLPRGFNPLQSWSE
jgi:hypothetical protein